MAPDRLYNMPQIAIASLVLPAVMWHLGSPMLCAIPSQQWTRPQSSMPKWPTLRAFAPRLSQPHLLEYSHSSLVVLLEGQRALSCAPSEPCSWNKNWLGDLPAVKLLRPLVVNSWQRLTVPLAELGVAGKALGVASLRCAGGCWDSAAKPSVEGRRRD
jgi:hypothetical protein